MAFGLKAGAQSRVRTACAVRLALPRKVPNANGLPKGARMGDCPPRPMPRKPIGPDGPRPAPEGARRLRAELLAAAAAAGAQDLLAARGRLAGEEAVATGAHKIAGLEGTLHIILEKTGRPDRSERVPQSCRGRHTATTKQTGAVMGMQTLSQANPQSDSHRLAWGLAWGLGAGQAKGQRP